MFSNQETKFHKLFERSLFLLWYPAIFAGAMIGGLIPGIIATVVAALAILYFFIPPHGFLPIESFADTLRLTIFTTMGIVTSIFSQTLKNARNKEKQYLHALTASELDFREIVDLAADGIIEAHDGKIWAESHPSHGTTFHFKLPIAKPLESRAESQLKVSQI